jgi:DNA-directed RNA polymerase sigma subunit (sigma70/sigma32)
MAELLTKWRRATNQLSDELGRPPTHDEIAKLLGLSKKKLAIIKKAIRVANAGAQADQADAGWSIEETLMDGRGDAPDAELGKSDDLKQVLSLLDKMDLARGDRPADAVRAERRGAEDAQGDRRVPRADPRAGAADRGRGARQTGRGPERRLAPC